MTGPARSARSRTLAAALLVGAAGALALLLPRLPRERRVALDLADATDVTGVQLSWSPSGAEPVAAASWHYALGHAPRSLATKVSLPDGRYELDVLVEGAQGQRSLRRTLVLGDADDITVPLR